MLYWLQASLSVSLICRSQFSVLGAGIAYSKHLRQLALLAVRNTAGALGTNNASTKPLPKPMMCQQTLDCLTVSFGWIILLTTIKYNSLTESADCAAVIYLQTNWNKQAS